MWIKNIKCNKMIWWYCGIQHDTWGKALSMSLLYTTGVMNRTEDTQAFIANSLIFCFLSWASCVPILSYFLFFWCYGSLTSAVVCFCFCLSSFVIFVLFSLIVIAHLSPNLYTQTWGGHRGCDRMVVETTYAISVYHHRCGEFESRSGQGVHHNVIKLISDLRQVGVFFRVLRFPPSIKLTATI